MKHAILAGLLGISGAATAAGLPCGPAEKGTIELDGLTDDWKEVDGLDGGGRDANLSFTLKCNVVDDVLHLLVDVRDNYFVRTPQARPGEDHLELVLGGRRFVIFPGDARAIPTKAPKGIRAESALQTAGWALELAIPLRQVPGFRSGTPQIPFRAEVRDCDSKAALKTERRASLEGAIAFAEGDAALTAFLKDRGLMPGDVWWDKPLALGRRAGARALLAGRYLAVISDGYVYMELPFKDRKDLREARVVDLAGDGREALVLRYVERGAGGAREVLAAYRADAEQIRRSFAAETGKQIGANKIANKVSFVRRGKATDIVVEAGSATGFTQDSYREAPADDMIPVMLPWSDDRRARYQFRGDEYLRQ